MAYFLFFATLAFAISLIIRLNKLYALVDKLDTKLAEHFKYCHPQDYKWVGDNKELEVEGHLMRITELTRGSS